MLCKLAKIYSRFCCPLQLTTKHIIRRSISMHDESPVQRALKELQDIAVTPEQPEEFKEAVKIYNPLASCSQPAFVVFPNNVEDVQRSLCVANETGTPIAIKSGGHCFAGYSTTNNNGFVISLKKMSNVIMHEDMITVQAGANWGNVYEALDSSEYIAVGGCVPAVGIGGYILGGGYSMLSRAYGGLACDKAVSYTMVTANGKDVVTASNTKEENLFWALKGGGGGNFGVLIDVTLKVCPRPKKFIWKKLSYDDTESTERGLNAVGRSLTTLPKELNLDMAIHNFSGKRLLTLDAVYSDHHEDQVKEALNSLHPTSQNSQQEYESFLKLVEDYSKRHGFVHYEKNPVYIKGLMIDSLPPNLANYFAGLNIPPECLIEFVHMGGDIKNYSPTSTAFPHRSAEYSFFTYGNFNDHKHEEEAMQFATSTYDHVKKSTAALGSYVNYMDRHLEDWPHEYYGVNYSRLLEEKEKWNPIGQGSLHFQQEIGSTWSKAS